MCNLCISTWLHPHGYGFSLSLVLAAEEMHRAWGLHDGDASWNLEAQEGQLRNWYQSVANSEGWVDGQVKKKTVSGKRNIFS